MAATWLFPVSHGVMNTNLTGAFMLSQTGDPVRTRALAAAMMITLTVSSWAAASNASFTS